MLVKRTMSFVSANSILFAISSAKVGFEKPKGVIYLKAFSIFSTSFVLFARVFALPLNAMSVIETSPDLMSSLERAVT